MDSELRYFLTEGARTVKELARLTGKSTSTLYKALTDVPFQEGKEGKMFFLPPEAVENGAGATADAPSTPSTEEPAAIAPAPQNGPAKRGRKATGAGKRLYPSETLLAADDALGAGTYQNNRRKNSHGFKSLQLVIDNPGISHDEYVARGGRLNDLRWDLAHGNVKAEG